MPNCSTNAEYFRQREFAERKAAAAAHWSTRLLLNDDRPRSNLSTSHQVANLDLYQIAAAQLAIDREIKQRAIA